TTTAGCQEFPSVAADADGDFVVAWVNSARDTSDAAVYAQRYDAAGVPQGTEFPVNTTAAGDQLFAGVAADAAGDDVVAWVNCSPDGALRDVRAQRYSESVDTAGPIVSGVTMGGRAVTRGSV